MAVPDYRFYKVRLDGHVVGGPTLITCDDDEQAIAQASRLTMVMASRFGNWVASLRKLKSRRWPKMKAPDPGAGLGLSETLIENSLKWALLLLVMFAVNLVVATAAWMIVGLAMSG